MTSKTTSCIQASRKIITFLSFIQFSFIKYKPKIPEITSFTWEVFKKTFIQLVKIDIQLQIPILFPMGLS